MFEFEDYEYLNFSEKESGMDLEKKEEAKEWVEGMIDAMYTTGDTLELENCLDELCSIFDISIPKTDILLEKKNKNRDLHWYLGYQRATIENARVK